MNKTVKLSMSTIIQPTDPTSVKIERLENVLEIRAPVFATGTFQGGDYLDPVTRKLTKQPKIEYSPEAIKKIFKDAIGMQGDLHHSDQKQHVVSFLKELDYSHPEVVYGTIIVWKPNAIKAIQMGELKGLSIEAKVTDYEEIGENHYRAIDGFLKGYAHTPVPAVPNAKIESMRTIQLANGHSVKLSHTVLTESLNKQKNKDHVGNSNKHESVLTMSDELKELKEQVVKLSSKLAETTAKLEEKDQELTEKDQENTTIQTDAQKTKEEAEAKIIELTEKVAEYDKAIKDAQLAAEKEKLESLFEQIKEHEKEFDHKIWLTEDMSFDAAKKVLEALLAKYKKSAKDVDLSGLPALENLEINPDKQTDVGTIRSLFT